MLGWVLAIVVGMSIVYGLYPYYNPSEGFFKEMNPDVAALYESTHRFAWSLAVAWVVFACVTGYGGRYLIHFCLTILHDSAVHSLIP